MSSPTLPRTGAPEITPNGHIPPVLAVGTGDPCDSGVCCLMP
jgi:hypothetical protein